MGGSTFQHFSMPFESGFLNEAIDEKKNVVIVSVIGKGHHHMFHSKASKINDVIGCDVFQTRILRPSEDVNKESIKFDIEGYYDTKLQVIYLHLTSLYDTSLLVDLCRRAQQSVADKGPDAFLLDAEYAYARALLFLFSVSHMLLVVHPGCTFDVNYVRLFHNLDTIRLKLQSSLTEVLEDCGVSRDWMLAGRPCSPRVLFVFMSSNLEANGPSPDHTGVTRPRPQKTPPIKRLQHSIEDQIYRILRKARIITNISNNSLFAVPANQEFVFVESTNGRSLDIVGHLLCQLKNNCDSSKEQADACRRWGYGGSGGGNISSPPGLMLDEDALSSNSFRQFLSQHIQLALTKGFDDNVGRNPPPALFEVPSLSTWIEVSSKLYGLFNQSNEVKIRPTFNTLKSLIEVDLRFSEGRCAKVLPIAEGMYQEGLPQHYTKSLHLQALGAAKRKLSQHARGPAAGRYLKQLEESCDKLWRAGRRLCENVSLTGNPCLNPLHATVSTAGLTEYQHLPIMPHSSQVRPKFACNCGRTQAERDDPFDHKNANFSEYEVLRGTCCGELEAIPLPVFEPSTSEVKAAVVGGYGSQAEIRLPATRHPSARKDSTKLDVTHQMSNLSLALSLDQTGHSSNRSHEADLNDSSSYSSGQSGCSDLFVTDGGSNSHVEGGKIASQLYHESGDGTVVEPSTSAVLVRQHSTTEYLPTMIHSRSPPGLLPKFPSWSLVALGKYSSYVPSQGLDQPGFLHSSNYLLPYDVMPTGDRDKWPILDAKKVKGRKFTKDSAESSSRLYIGIEYECPRGHRFFCIGPDKILKAPGSGGPKESAQKIVMSDMPLYTPCPCRSSKGFVAQLIRVFVAVPEGPVDVKLKPMVQPAASGCPLFHPGHLTPISISCGNIWVLRLPSFYVSEHDTYRIPNAALEMTSCRLLRGLFHITRNLEPTIKPQLPGK